MKMPLALALCLTPLAASAQDFIQPASLADLAAPEFTARMIQLTGAFQVDLAEGAPLVFLRQPDGRYTIAAHLPEAPDHPGCATVHYSNALGDYHFGLCRITDWTAPEGFEAQISEGTRLADFTDALAGAGLTLPVGPDAPPYVAAITYNGSPDLNRALWDAQSQVIWACRDPDPWSRSASGLQSPELGFDTARRDCRNRKSSLRGQHLLVAEGTRDISAEARAAAEARAEAAEARLAETAEARAAAEARLAETAEARAAAEAAEEASRQRLEFISRIVSALPG